MKHEEKVYFLFDQTLKAVLNKKGAGVNPDVIKFYFNDYYKVFEKILNEKLDEK